MVQVIPSMGGAALSKGLIKYTMKAPDHTAAVLLGTWLGADTLPLILGVEKSGKDIEVHSYDCFEIHGNEVDKAAKFGVELHEGQDTLPLVKEYLSGHDFVKTFLHKGEITNQTWMDRRISIYVDDACKYEKEFILVLKIFSPFWIPGETIVILRDFYFYLQRPYDKGLRFQKYFIQSQGDSFRFISGSKKLCTAIFRYMGGIKL
jgi:hypothetical protein